jgi:hypothetical protein
VRQQLNRRGEESHTPTPARALRFDGDIEYADEITIMKAMEAGATSNAGQEIHLREF